MRVDTLKNDNARLEERIHQKKLDLQQLKELFLDTAKAKSDAGIVMDLEKLLADDDADNDNQPSSSKKSKK